MNHLFDEILEFQYKIPFIFHLKNLLRPTISSLLHPNLFKYITNFIFVKHLHTDEIFLSQ